MKISIPRLDLFPQPIELARQLRCAAGRSSFTCTASLAEFLFNLNRNSRGIPCLGLFPQPIELARQLGYAARRSVGAFSAEAIDFLVNLTRKSRSLSRLDLFSQPIELADLFGAFQAVDAPGDVSGRRGDVSGRCRLRCSAGAQPCPGSPTGALAGHLCDRCGRLARLVARLTIFFSSMRRGRHTPPPLRSFAEALILSLGVTSPENRDPR